MKRYAKTWPIIISLCLLFFCLAPHSYGQPDELLKFEEGATLEEIREVIQHNGYDFSVDHNWVFDMPAEMKEDFLSRRPSRSPAESDGPVDIGPLAEHLGKQLPAAFDWRDYGGHSYIGPIKDQSYCGSCYAFGAAAAAEGTFNAANNLYDGACVDFSESFIIWCLGRLPLYNPHFYGCYGADYDYYELQALVDVGITTEANFPYTISDPGTCAHWNDPRVTFESWHRIPCNDIDAIKTAIMTFGVVDAAVYVGPAFQGYSGGIYEDSNVTCYSTPCYYTPTNHAISLVGWNDNGDPVNNGYWILRNSWDTTWGEAGYMRIKYRSAFVSCEACYLVLESREPVPDVKVNGGDDPLIVSPVDNVLVTASLDPGDMTGEMVDWWMGVISPYGVFWYLNGTYPIFELPEITMLDSALPPGLWIFFLALDDTPDGIIGLTWYDYVTVQSLTAGM